jgi:hypothetical protein
MPIVIEELSVQVEVNTQNAENRSQPPQQPNTAGAESNPKAALIKACVDEVMEVLRHQNER